MKTMNFNQNDSNWHICTFYIIFIKDDKKYIKIIGSIDRVPNGEKYLAWLCSYYTEKCQMPLEQFILFSNYYQMEILCYNNIESEIITSPFCCFQQANEWVKADGKGSEFKKILDITKDTPCGYFYGY